MPGHLSSHLLRSDIFGVGHVLGPSSPLQKQNRLLPSPTTGLSVKAKSLGNDNNKNRRLVTAATKFLGFSGACCTLQMIVAERVIKMGHLGLVEEKKLPIAALADIREY